MDRKHVIVAEDEALIGCALQMMLEDAGLRVTVAQDGMEALNAYARDPADLLITDIRMPRMTGWDLIYRLRTDFNPELPVIVVSGHAQHNPIMMDGARASTSILRKPVDARAFLSNVETALGLGKERVA